MPASVTGLQIELIAHATEDLDRVVEALLAVIPPEARGKVKLRKKSFKGHHGNPITFLRIKVRDRELAQAIFEHIGSRLEEADKVELSRGLRRRLKGGSLYLRLDKQWAVLGRLRLCSSDPIWIKISFSSSRPEDVLEACREAGLVV